MSFQSKKNELLEKAKRKKSILSSIFLFIYDALRHSKLIEFFRCKPWMDDKRYIELKYKKIFGVKPNLENPRSFNEKNNWRKLYDRKDVYTQMVDKYAIKEIIKERVGSEYTFPLLGAWKKVSDIDIDSLPDSFVLKVNHSGGVIVCREKKTFDFKKAFKELEGDLRMDYFPISREWPYKNVNRRVICEKYMGDNLIDYKNYCFNGKVKYTCVWKNVSKEDGRKPDPFFCGAYSTNWSKTGMALKYPSLDETVEKPVCYAEMVRIAEIMSEGIPFVRVDCYIIKGKPYIVEMTFFPYGGFLKFEGEYWNYLLGETECLPDV